MKIALLILCVIAASGLTLVAKEKKPKLKIGDTAPSFCAPDQNGKNVTFPTDIKGRKVLVFYPKASNPPIKISPGCAKEMCSLRDEQPDLKRHNITVVGISPSKPKDQKSFQDSYKLPFVLLTADDAICKLYQVHGLFFIDRHTFLIDENNRIVKIITKVDKKRPGAQILEGFGIK